MNRDISELKGARVLISGGLGFIGSNLARKLVEVGAEVTVIDSLIPEYGGNLSNITGIRDKISVNISDVRDEFSMKYLVQDKDLLFNLAGQTSHLDSMQNPFVDLEINARAQLSILEACRKHNTGIKIVFASTRQIYGRPDYLPVNELHPSRPVDVNGINKLAGEWYHILYNNVYGINACALRLTNTYGPRMRIKDARQTFLGIWIRNIIEGREIEVWGGEQLRDFTYVDDVAEAMILAALDSNSNGKIYNLGGVEIISLRQLAELLVKTYGKGKYVIKEFPEERKRIDIGDYYSDGTLIKEELGWHPTINIAEGLRLTIGYYRENISNYL